MAETKLGKDAVTIPVGTTAQRPSNPEPGMIRFNTDMGQVEWYDEATDVWSPVSKSPAVIATGGTVTDVSQGGVSFRVHTFTSNGTFEVTRGGEVDVLLVGGGGGAGSRHGGGGGAGGVINGTIILDVNDYNISVGDGGVGDPNETRPGLNGERGSNTTAFGDTALGGGGGSGSGDAPDSVKEGGSAGGVRDTNTGQGQQQDPTNIAGTGFGNRAGNWLNPDCCQGAGGGGAGGPGEDATSPSNTSNGGDGIQVNIDGNSFYWGGGGGGGEGSRGGRGSDGGIGGGGAGSGSNANGGGSAINSGEDAPNTNDGGSAGANTGGGGGGGGDGTASGGNGGSGIVIIRYRR